MPADKVGQEQCLTFLLFVLSGVVLETILAIDERRERRRKSERPSVLPSDSERPAETLLPLLRAIEEHGRGRRPEIGAPTPSTESSDEDCAYNHKNGRRE